MSRLGARTTDHGRTLAAIWVLATGAGAVGAIAFIVTGAAGLAYVVSLAAVLVVPFAVRGRRMQLAASGLLVGLVLTQLLAGAGWVGCLFDDGPCQPDLGTVWLFVLAVATAEGLSLLVLAARDLAGPFLQTGEPGGSRRRRRVGHSAIRELERKLGIGVVVQSVAAGPPVAIEALLLYGALRHPVVASGATEPEAWQDLATIVLAWSQSNVTKVPMWWGGGAP